jgi:hypothetical protein
LLPMTAILFMCVITLFTLGQAPKRYYFCYLNNILCDYSTSIL